MAKINKITNEGYKKLQDELRFLKTIRRREVGEAIKAARALGDLSENSEYDEAREEQAKVEARIVEIEAMLELLLEMAKKYGKTIIIVTHNQNIAKMADVVIEVRSGKIRSCVEQENPLSADEVDW